MIDAGNTGFCQQRPVTKSNLGCKHDDRPTEENPVRVPLLAGNSKVLQALRALSALCVVFYHANISFFGNAHYWADQPIGHVMDFGHAGVEFFFVLSGFIIYAAHSNDIGNPARLGNFLWKRFRRIYPVYWVVLGLILPMFLLIPSFGSGGEQRLGQILDSVLLMHLFDGGQIVSVSWTLFHEIAFYAVFAIIIANRTLGLWAIVAWSVASAASLAGPGIVPPGLGFILSPLHVLFGMGMVAAWLVGRRRVALPALVLAFGVVVFVAAAVDDVAWHRLSTDLVAVVYGIGSTFILVGAVELERGGKLRVSRVLTFLGDASYSVYLVHVTAMSVLAKVALTVMAHVAVPHALTYLALVAGSIAAGLVFHMFVELPLLSLLAQVKFGAKSARRGAAALPGLVGSST